MNRDEIMAEVAGAIRQTFRQPDAEISRDTVALDVDGWDSLSHTMLILEVEKRFGVRLPPERVFDLEDVGELVDLVAETKGV
jgi:acyl carrier protein